MVKKLRVGALDAGMVFRADGTVEILMPRVPEDREPPDNVLAAGALLWEEMFNEIVRAMEREEEEPCN
jgi:hypothetical protein